MDDSRGMRVFNESCNACLGTVEEHFVRARAEDEECRQVVRDERLERAPKGSRGSGHQVSCSPGEPGALRIECRVDWARR